MYTFTDCATLTVNNADISSSVNVTLTNNKITGLGSPITFYLWSLQDSTMFFSDNILSRVAGWYDQCNSSLRYQSAKVSVWATFSNEEVGVNITADVTTFVHEVSAQNTHS